MKKYDDQQRMKNFQSKIKNAKPQVPLTSNPKSSTKIKDQGILNETLRSQRSSISGYYNSEKDDKNSIPLYRLLKLHNLQQYAQFLITRGYGYDLTKFAYLTVKELEKLTEEMKVLPGHKSKFLDLINFINNLISQMPEFQTKPLSPGLSTQGGSTSTQQRRKTHQNSTGNIFKNNQKAPATANISKGPGRARPTQTVTALEHTQNQVVPQKKLPRIVQDDITVVHQYKDEKIVIQQADNKMMRNLEKRLTQTKTKKRPNKYEDEQDENYPDLQVSEVKMMYQSYDSKKLTSTLINLDIEEMCNCLAWAIVKHIQFNDKKPFLIDSIVRSQIYLNNKSYRGKNGDVSQNPMEEPTYYYGYNDPQTGLFQSQMNKIITEENYDSKKNDLRAISEKTIETASHKRGMNDYNDQKSQIEQILKESILIINSAFDQQGDEDDFMADQFYEENSSEEYDSDGHDQSPIKQKYVPSYNQNSYQQPSHHNSHRLHSQVQNQQDNDDSLQYEDDSALHNYTQSNRIDSSFESKYETADREEDDEKSEQQIFHRTYFDADLGSAIPSQEVVSNYCKNIITSSKMEKEVTIICLVYIERLLMKTGFGLEPGNWRKITFTALIIASKIWDDESFENDNFSKAFSQFSTKQINELERIFLKFIDYQLLVKSSDYAKYYFILRTFAESRKKSFPLKPLDLNTILYLQRNANKAERSLKDHYNNPQNKSF